MVGEQDCYIHLQIQMRTQRLCFVIPYFGHFPNYFPLFLKTCGANSDYNWLIFTDDQNEYDYPKNVQRVKMTFEECKLAIKSKFNCPINIGNPYKLCDLKPMYGYIFEEYLKDYRFWGHCDVDTIMGNLSNWLTDDFLEQYDKIFCLGHLTIYRNTADNNRIFMLPYGGKEIYKDVLLTPTIYTFDEEWKDNANICRLFESYGKRCFRDDYSLNIACAYNKFHRIQYVGREKTPNINGYQIEKYKEAVYLWNDGDLCRYFVDKGKLCCEHFLYMHLQQRCMRIDSSILNNRVKCLKIVNDEFVKKDFDEISVETFPIIKKSGFCWHTQRIALNRAKRKIKSIFNKK